MVAAIDRVRRVLLTFQGWRTGVQHVKQLSEGNPEGCGRQCRGVDDARQRLWHSSAASFFPAATYFQLAHPM